jgi:predicted Zn-dependent peptidase
MRQHYLPHRMLISVAGCVKPAEVKAAVRRLFGPWSARTEKAAGHLAPIPPVQPASTTLFRKQEQAHICLGVRTFPFADPRRLALLGVSNILGGGTNSRLFYEVRERRALAYSVYSFVDFYQDTGMTGVYAACHPRKVRETIQVIADEIGRLQTRQVTVQEWKDLREQMKGNLLLSLESTSAHMWRMVQHEVYLKAHPSTASILRSVERLTREALQQAACDVFGANPLTLSVVGPVTSRQLPAVK